MSGPSQPASQKVFNSFNSVLQNPENSRERKKPTLSLQSTLNEFVLNGSMTDLIKLVKEYAVTTQEIEYAGGIAPAMRRQQILASNMSAQSVAIILATCRRRGHRIGNFISKNDRSANAIRNAAKDCMIKVVTRKGSVDWTGLHTVVAFKVALSDFCMAISLAMGQDRFGDEVYGGPCPQQYQFIGSLGCMYVNTEETDLADAIGTYISWTEDYTNWYISVRNNAARIRGAKVGASDAEIENARNRNRSFYPNALASFDRTTRKAWSEGRYNITAVNGDLKFYQGEEVLKIVAAICKVGVDEIRAAASRGSVRSDGSGSGAHKGNNEGEKKSN